MRLGLAQYAARQLGAIGRDPSRLILAEQLGRRAPSRLIGLPLKRPRVEPAAGVASCVVQLLGPGEAVPPNAQQLAAKMLGPPRSLLASQARGILRSVF